MVVALVMNVLLAVALMQTVGFSEEKRCGRERRERGKSLRHLTEVEGVEGDGGSGGRDLGDSHAYQGETTDEEVAKEQASVRIYNAVGGLSEWTCTGYYSNWI